MKPKHRSPGASTRALALGVALCLSSASALAALNPKASRLYEDALQRFDKKDYAGTIIQLKNALQIDRKMLAVQVLLGRALLANGEYVAAQAAFEEALALGVNAAEVVLPLAESIEGQGKPGVVLSDPRFAHAALPQDVKARLLRLKAAAATDVGQPRDALAFL
ncbi:MAG TPA: PEP-CTERM system TPR-repeat protein PrsT, partial [Rubrivivax sp.]|nr:PEP-CTERM system TPR-repeat protein PrsT [Rubrivivax sp.]